MTKRELLKKFEGLEKEKGVHIDGINQNSNKSSIQRAINCLCCSDEMLEKYLVIVSLKYPAIGKTISENGDFKKHGYNRKYVYDTARSILNAY